MLRRVSSLVRCTVVEPAVLELQLAVAAGHPVEESLEVELDGVRLEAEEHVTTAGGRLHLLRAQPGELVARYRADVTGLLAGQGVCRDYAHLVVALLRTSDVPARVVSVYAPGLHPMDFHAVAEALVDDAWQVVDATLLAPRASLVRVATGRDAADTAFLSTYAGQVQFEAMEVSAVVLGDLPGDDPTRTVQLT